MESRVGASSGHGGAWWPSTGGQACQGCAATRGAGGLAVLSRAVCPRAQAWGNSGAGEEGPCTCAHAWGSAGAGEAGPCPRAHAWGSSGGGQQRTQGTRERASLPRERRRCAGARILGRVTGSAASRHRRSSSGRIRRRPVGHRAPPAAARETREGGRRGRDGLGIGVGTNWGLGKIVGSFFAKCQGGEAAGSHFFWLPLSDSAPVTAKKGASSPKPFWLPPFGRASASATGEAAAKALPKGLLDSCK
jgi:hypothetical protein